MKDHRIRFCEHVHRHMMNYSFNFVTDLAYGGGDVAWYDFAYYSASIPYHTYFKVPRDHIKGRKFNIQKVYACPDLRGLDDIWSPDDIEITEKQAENIIRSMLPTCLIANRNDNGDCYLRPELNAKHDNPTGYVIFNKAVHAYAYALTYPKNMNILKYTQTRNVSNVKRPC